MDMTFAEDTEFDQWTRFGLEDPPALEQDAIPAGLLCFPDTRAQGKRPLRAERCGTLGLSELDDCLVGPVLLRKS